MLSGAIFPLYMSKQKLIFIWRPAYFLSDTKHIGSKSFKVRRMPRIENLNQYFFFGLYLLKKTEWSVLEWKEKKNLRLKLGKICTEARNESRYFWLSSIYDPCEHMTVIVYLPPPPPVCRCPKNMILKLLFHLELQKVFCPWNTV